MMDIQRKLVQERSDDVESFTEMLAIYDAALFCHGRDEEEVSDHVEEHKRGKADQRDQLVRGKHHLARVHLDRVALQWEVATWLKNLLVMESLPPDMLTCLMT